MSPTKVTKNNGKKEKVREQQQSPFSRLGRNFQISKFF